MKEAWQKTVVFLLALAVLAAFTLGRRGESNGTPYNAGAEESEAPGGEAKSGENALQGGNGGRKEAQNIGNGMQDEADEEEGRERRAGRVAREGKLPQGWEEPPCIVIDAGHGGYDPGKMGINGVPEKDVNLAVAKLLRDYLEACGVRVVMTRQEDQALSGEGEDHAKVRDLKKRIEIMEEAKPILAVSIHQNSYPEEYVRGAQVFYYSTSREGAALANALQARLISEVDPENHRVPKENESYYLLKKTSVPIVIAECGFLSNWEEAEKLRQEAYQEEVAWALYLGIMDYLEEKK